MKAVTTKKHHNWDEWFKHESFIAKYADFSCDPERIPQQIRNAAYDRDLKVSIIHEKNKKRYAVSVTRSEVV